MRTIKRYMALCLVLVCIGAGGLLLMFDYGTTTAKCLAIAGAAVSFAAGLGLGYVFNRHNLLPE